MTIGAGQLWRAVRAAVALAVVLVAAVLAPRLGFAVLAGPLTYTAAEVPPRDVAIVLGARVFPGGHPSAMLADRLGSGADLYHEGKARVLLMTGDNSTLEYNEPDAMKRYAEGLGVPPDSIVVDYAGRRTYDSCYRAKHIFKVERAIIVTQAFHLDRALVLCNALGIDAVGVAADYQRPAGYRGSALTYSRLREIPAAVAAVIDLLRGPTPILGDPLPIEVDDDEARLEDSTGASRARPEATAPKRYSVCRSTRRTWSSRVARFG